MKDKLIKLIKFLDERGLSKEATPIQDIFEMSENSGRSVERSEKVFPNTKRESYNYEDYFDSLKNLRSNVYLVSFDFKNAPLNILRKIGYIFRIPHYSVKSYYDLIHNNLAAKKLGELRVFKLQFPKIYSLIEADADSKGIDPDEAFVIFFNKGEEVTEDLQDVLRNPYYFGHDVGHLIDDEIYEYVVDFFNNNIFTHFKEEPKFAPYEMQSKMLKPLVGEKSYIHYDDFLIYFFNDLQSQKEDKISDLISLSLSNKLSINDNFEEISSDRFPTDKEYEIKSDEDFNQVIIKLF